MSRRSSAVLAGAVAFSCLGLEKEDQVAALRAGRCGLGPVGESCLVAEPTLVAGAVPACEGADDRAAALADELVDRLLDATGWSERQRRTCGVFAAAANGASPTEELVGLRRLRRGEPWRSDLLTGGPGRLTAHVASRWGSRGPQFTYTTACTSSAVALVMATRMLAAGIVDRALVFGVDVLMKASIEGFRRLQLYSESACRPFDATRDGLQIGEGCVGIALEPSDGFSGGRFHFLGGCVAHDPSHIAAGSNDGRTAAWIMGEAVRSCGVGLDQIAAVKAHGTGTITNDLSELRGLRQAFGDAVPPFASLKGGLGHTLGCCSALETVLWTGCLGQEFIPASAGFEHPEGDGLPSPLRSPLRTEGRPGFHLFSAFGFGGTSVAYVLADRGAP